MKKYFGGLVAITIAVVCFAFTSTKATGPDCTGSLNYYWFHVKAGIGATNCATLAQSDFVDVLDPNQNGVIDAGELVATLPQGAPTTQPYGCPDVNTKICALAFDSRTASQQITVVFDAAINKFKFVPIATELPNYKCCVKRSTN